MCAGVQERSKLQLLAAGAGAGGPGIGACVELETSHVRKHPVRANAEVRPPSQAAALPVTSFRAPL